MHNCEDSDIKIAGKNSFSETEEHIDTIAFLEETRRQHFNGNTAKAKTLGRGIVSAFSYKSAPDELYALVCSHGIEPDSDIMLQIKILSVFSAEYCLNNFLGSPHLSSVAVDEMYDLLTEMDPEFFELLTRSASFSFYYLCVKQGGDIAGNVSEEFSKLLTGGRDERFVSLGRELFDMNTNVFRRAISGFVFA